MNQMVIRKNRKTWTITGLVGMSSDELNSVLDKLLVEPGLSSDCNILILTKSGRYESWRVPDLSNDSSRSMLLEKL